MTDRTDDELSFKAGEANNLTTAPHEDEAYLHDPARLASDEEEKTMSAKAKMGPATEDSESQLGSKFEKTMHFEFEDGEKKISQVGQAIKILEGGATEEDGVDVSHSNKPVCLDSLHPLNLNFQMNERYVDRPPSNEKLSQAGDQSMPINHGSPSLAFQLQKTSGNLHLMFDTDNQSSKESDGTSKKRARSILQEHPPRTIEIGKVKIATQAASPDTKSPRGFKDNNKIEKLDLMKLFQEKLLQKSRMVQQQQQQQSGFQPFNQDLEFQKKAAQSVLANHDSSVIDKYLFSGRNMMDKMKAFFKKQVDQKIDEFGPETLPEVSNPDVLKAIVAVLKKKPEKRYESDLNLILPYVKNMTMFRKRVNAEGERDVENGEDIYTNIAAEMSQEDYRFICEHMRYQFKKQGETIIRYGDFGTEFYILIKGKASILVPRKKMATKAHGGGGEVSQKKVKESTEIKKDASVISPQMSSYLAEPRSSIPGSSIEMSRGRDSRIKAINQQSKESISVNTEGDRVKTTPDGDYGTTQRFDHLESNMKLQESGRSMTSFPKRRITNSNVPSADDFQRGNEPKQLIFKKLGEGLAGRLQGIKEGGASSQQDHRLPNELISFLQNIRQFDTEEDRHSRDGDDTSGVGLDARSISRASNNKKIKVNMNVVGDIVNRWLYACKSVGLSSIEEKIIQAFKTLAIVNQNAMAPFQTQEHIVRILVKNYYIDMEMHAAADEATRKSSKLATTSSKLSQDALNRFEATMQQIVDLTKKNICLVKVLEDGASFGEQALIMNAQRAATIKCQTDCFLGVLNKNDFDRSIGKIMKRKMERLINFMKECPEFTNWSKTALSKLFYYWKKETFLNGQVVYRQGQKCDKIFLVYSGEFTSSIQEGVKPNRQFAYTDYLGPNKSHLRQFEGEDIETKKLRHRNHTGISISQAGMMLGDEDAVNLESYSKTVKCSSQKGELLVMQLTDFLQRVKFNDDTWDLIQQRATDKNKYDEKVTKISKRMKFRKVLKRDFSIPEADRIQPIDFFSVSYNGARIPELKINRVINRLRSKNQTQKPDPLQVGPRTIDYHSVQEAIEIQKQQLEDFNQKFEEMRTKATIEVNPKDLKIGTIAKTLDNNWETQVRSREMVKQIRSPGQIQGDIQGLYSATSPTSGAQKSNENDGPLSTQGPGFISFQAKPNNLNNPNKPISEKDRDTTTLCSNRGEPAPQLTATHGNKDFLKHIESLRQMQAECSSSRFQSLQNSLKKQQSEGQGQGQHVRKKMEAKSTAISLLDQITKRKGKFAGSQMQAVPPAPIQTGGYIQFGDRAEPNNQMDETFQEYLMGPIIGMRSPQGTSSSFRKFVQQFGLSSSSRGDRQTQYQTIYRPMTKPKNMLQLVKQGDRHHRNKTVGTQKTHKNIIKGTTTTIVNARGGLKSTSDHQTGSKRVPPSGQQSFFYPSSRNSSIQGQTMPIKVISHPQTPLVGDRGAALQMASRRVQQRIQSKEATPKALSKRI